MAKAHEQSKRLTPSLTREQKIARVLTSQGRPKNEANLFDEKEKDLLAALCGDNGGLVVDARFKFGCIVTARNERLEAGKASA